MLLGAPGIATRSKDATRGSTGACRTQHFIFQVSENVKSVRRSGSDEKKSI